MKHRAFFAYCTSLRPIELKALGALSQVRHFRDGEIVYAPGEKAEEFFIINRGVAELCIGRGAGIREIVLSRGDLFGATAPLREQPRDHAARARGQLSVQCFRCRDFPELLQRVPSFFLFLCERLASRLFQVGELVRSHASALELTGSLANFDVATIYQTILHSRQTGLLTIANKEGKKVSEFFFDKGTPRWGRFEDLTGEEAFSQLFLQDDQAATFTFANGPDRNRSAAPESAMDRQPDELLIAAIQMRDEFEDLRKRLRQDSHTLRRNEVNFRWEKEAAELRPVAEALWRLAQSRAIELSELNHHVNFCDLKIYKAVEEMIRLGLVKLENANAEAVEQVA